MACSAWRRQRSAKPSDGGFDSRTGLFTSASFVYRHRTPRSHCGKAGSTPARGTRGKSFTGCSSAWTRARAWDARGRWFESSHPDFFLWVWLSLVERTVRIREVAGSSPATQTCRTRSNTGHGPMVGLSSDTRAVLVRFQVPRLCWLMAKGEPPGRDPGSRGFESLQPTSLCSWMRLDRSAAVYRVNRVRFPAGALAAPALPPWRRWFARLSEKQEDQVRFLGTALASSPV